MTTATLQAKINGGAPQTGGIYANLNDSVQLTAPDKSGWGNPPTKWQIYDFPKGFALPGGGWAVDTDGSYFFLGSNDPPPFTLNPWGYYGTRLFVLGGATSANGATDESTVIRVLSPTGLKDPGRREGLQFGSAIRGNTESFKDNLRIVDAMVSGAIAAAVALTAGTQTITYGQGSWRTIAAGTVVANEVITLGTAGAISGNQIRLTRYDLSTNSVTVTNGGAGGGSYVLVADADIMFQFDGTNWNARELTPFSQLTLYNGAAAFGELYYTASTFNVAALAGNSLALTTSGNASLQSTVAAATVAAGSTLFLVGAGQTTFGTPTVIWGNSALSQIVRTDTMNPTGASTLAWAAGVTSITDSWAQNASGAGGSRTISGQQGKAGSLGGDIFVISGLGGTPATNLAGKIHLDDGATVAAISAGISLDNAGVQYGIIKNNTGYCYFGSTTNSVLLSSSAGSQFVLATTCQFISAYGFTFNTPTVQYLSPASATPFFDCTQVASNQRVTAICASGVATSTTTNPVGSGDGVARVAKCLVVPTVPPDTADLTLYNDLNRNALCTWEGTNKTQHIGMSMYDRSAISVTTRRRIEFTDTATTASVAAGQVICTIPATDIPQSGNAAGKVELAVIIQDTTTPGNSSFYDLRFRINVNAGVVTATGMTTVYGNGAVGATYALNISAGAVQVTVTPGSANALHWTAIVDAYIKAY